MNASSSAVARGAAAGSVRVSPACDTTGHYQEADTSDRRLFNRLVADVQVVVIFGDEHEVAAGSSAMIVRSPSRAARRVRSRRWR